MSTTKLKKLREAIERASALIAIVVVGDQPTNYPQDAVENLNTAIEAAAKVAGEEASEAKSIDEAIALLQTAENAFRALEIPQPEKKKTKTVRLIGTESERTGAHSLHYENIIINFRDGEAELLIELAEKLIEAGYAE